MSETLQPIPEEGTTSRLSDDDLEYPVNDQASHLRSPPGLSSQFHTHNFSVASFQSHLFTHSWNRLGSYSIPDLCSYIESTPPAPISLLKWCKGRNGLRHEFLLLKVDRPENDGSVWLRLERRVHQSALATNCIISPVLSGDTVKLSNDFSLLFDASESEVRVEAEFTDPLPLETLRTLLSTLTEESPNYNLYSENCYFFCAVIYKNLISVGNGVNVTGTPSKFSNYFGPKTKARIKKRMASSPSEPSDGLPGLKSPKVPYIPLPTRASVPQETEKTVARHPITSQEASNPRIEHEPSPYNRVSTSDRPSSVIKTGNAATQGILLDIPPHVHQDGGRDSPPNASPDGPPHSSFLRPLSKRISPVNSVISGGENPFSGFPLRRPEAHPRDLNSSQGRMCVAVDFGTILSGVACGLSSDVVEQIIWPGPNRKVPTSLVYDAQGHVVAWGHRSQAVDLRKGWIRCEMFKLLLDPNGASNLIPRILPLGKEPIDVITDYLRELWQNAKPKILKLGYTGEALRSADIWLSIPAMWNLRNGEMMRDAAYAAGLVAPEGSEEYAGGRDRLHIISEPEAMAMHCLVWEDLKLKLNQSFMVCEARANTINTAIYQVIGDITQIAELCASSGASCGSHFLDINFRAYLLEWHRTRNLRLREDNLARYMHSFTYSQKLAFNGKQEGGYLLFECFDTADYHKADLSDDEFFSDQLVVPVKDLRERVFDPIVNEVLSVLEAQLKRVGSVDALLLVGQFSEIPYLFNRIWDTFHERMHGRILNPIEPDIAVSLGAVQFGLARSLIQRPIGSLTIITSKSYIIGIGPNLAISPGGTWSSGNAAGMMIGFNGVFEAQYLITKGTLLQKGEPVFQEFTKTSSNPSDSVFVAGVYTSDSAEIRADTSEGDLEHIQDWKIDLSGMPPFEQNAQNSLSNTFDTVFEIGIEIDSLEVHIVWACDGKRRGRLRLPGIPGN